MYLSTEIWTNVADHEDEPTRIRGCTNICAFKDRLSPFAGSSGAHAPRFTQFCGEWHRYCMLEWMDGRLQLGYSLQFCGVPLFLWFCQRSKLLLSGEERFLLGRDSELRYSVIPHDKEGSVLRTYFLVPCIETQGLPEDNLSGSGTAVCPEPYLIPWK